MFEQPTGESVGASVEATPLPAGPAIGLGEAGMGSPAPPSVGYGLPLTRRQLEIVELVSEGCTNRAIGERLGISAATVKRHLERIYDRVGVRTRAGVAAKVLLASDPSRPRES